MRKTRLIEQNRCYHLISRLVHRAFFLDDEEKDRAVALMRRVEAEVQVSMSYCINKAVSISSDPFDPLGIQGSDCTTTWKRNPVNIPVGQKRERNLPHVYPVRNVVGDRAIGHFEGQISSFALSGMNLTVEDDGLIVDVHIKSIKIEGSFSFKVDLTYRNFIKE